MREVGCKFQKTFTSDQLPLEAAHHHTHRVVEVAVAGHTATLLDNLKKMSNKLEIYSFFLSSRSNFSTWTQVYTTRAMRMKLRSCTMKCPSLSSTGPRVMTKNSRSLAVPRINPSSGLMISLMKVEISREISPPRIKPTASPTMPCLRINSMNPFIRIRVIK